MRTVTKIVIDLTTLTPKREAQPDVAARELVEVLLAEERFIWPEHEPLRPDEILEAYRAYAAKHKAEGLPTDPDGHALVGFVREFLRLDPGDELGLELDRETQLKFNAMRHALSILAQIPHDERDDIKTVWRVIEDRQVQVYGLMFQTDNVFTFRLRHHNPESLKSATERLVAALAPRRADEISRLLESVPTVHIARVTDELRVDFDRVRMRTPAGEPAQIGDVHKVGSARRLVVYVGWRSPQRVLLILATALLVADLLVQTFIPDFHVEHLEAVDWMGGTLGRLTTAAFTAYLFAILLDYIRLRGKFRGRSAAFIDWSTPEPGT